MADKSNDPVAIWHTMLGEMEKGFNAFANQAMASPQFSKVVNQVGGASAGAQKQVGELMEKYLASMNLPSRAQLTNFGERLQAIEGQLNEITALLRQVHDNTGTKAVAPDGAAATPPKPPRTKRPPPSAGGEPK
jgi:xylose isomerase